MVAHKHLNGNGHKDMLKSNFGEEDKQNWAEKKRHNTTWHDSQILGDGHRLHNKYKLHFAFTFHWDWREIMKAQEQEKKTNWKHEARKKASDVKSCAYISLGL